jgi:hypothetical protein
MDMVSKRSLFRRQVEDTPNVSKHVTHAPARYSDLCCLCCDALITLRLLVGLAYLFSLQLATKSAVEVVAFASVVSSSIFYTFVWYFPDSYKRFVAPRDPCQVSDPCEWRAFLASAAVQCVGLRPLVTFMFSSL